MQYSFEKTYCDCFFSFEKVWIDAFLDGEIICKRMDFKTDGITYLCNFMVILEICIKCDILSYREKEAAS